MIGGLHRCPCRYGLTPSTHKGTDLQQQTEALQPKLAASQHGMSHFQGTPFVGSKLGQHDGDVVGPGQINDLHHLCQALGTPQACSTCASNSQVNTALMVAQISLRLHLRLPGQAA